MFARIVRSALRASRIVVASLERSSTISAISAVSNAMSVPPAPIPRPIATPPFATPTLAAAKRGRVVDPVAHEEHRAVPRSRVQVALGGMRTGRPDLHGSV